MINNDSTSLLTTTSPIYASFEVGIAGMSDEVSIKARLMAAGLSYFAGMGWAFGKTRDISRKYFKINDQTSEKTQAFHDSLLSGAFNLVVAPIIYYACGVSDPKQLAIGTATAIGFGIAQGPLLGYTVDVGRDLVGLHSCERRTYPRLVRNQPPRFKKAIAVGLITASIALMSGIYSLTPNTKEIPTQPQQGLERVITEDNFK